jgi:xanthine dehydrogenase accessory factor
MELYAEMLRLRQANRPFAVATIVESKGSTPRHSAKMLVQSDGSIEGTIGGGPVEQAIIREARDAIAAGADRMVKYELDANAPGGAPMYCGGSLSVFIEVSAAKPRLVLVGAGHVGKAVARLAASLDYQVVVVDDRPDFATAAAIPEGAEFFVHTDIAQAVRLAPIDENTYVAIFTKDSDEAALRAVLERGAAYVGMIGSKRKVIIIREHLAAAGADAERLAAVRAPIGLDLGAETPAEIAVSVMAEIMAVRSGSSALPMSGNTTTRTKET